MNQNPEQRQSFVVRIWTEPPTGKDPTSVWRGWVQHVRSGESVYIQSPQELLDFIHGWFGSFDPPPDHHLK
ncbi:MAG: hypothetical protein GXP37_06105 [Chloroflexi bacterium]|nr:hypothetical protein [Chloroflexota bacterium]